MIFPLYFGKSSVAIKVKEDGAGGANYALADAVDIRGSVPINLIRFLSPSAGWHLLLVPDSSALEYLPGLLPFSEAPLRSAPKNPSLQFVGDKRCCSRYPKKSPAPKNGPDG